MTDAEAVRKARTLFWSGAALQGSVVTGAIVATAFGMRIPLPTWLIIAIGCLTLASSVTRTTRTKTYLIVAGALLSISEVVIILVTRP